MLVLVVADVFMRDAFNKPITGTAEIVAVSMVSMVLGVGWCAVQGRHLTVTLVTDHMPSRARAIMDIITFLAVLGMSILMAARGFIEGAWDKKFGYTASEIVLIPTFPFWWAYSLGLVLLCLVVITIIIQRVREALKR
jgi:TRAP-type C4-dicarboxylate transport system permease small subunit